MSQLEQVLFKIYTDPQYRRNVQTGTEQLIGLSDDERAAVKELSFHEVSGPERPTDITCDGR